MDTETATDDVTDSIAHIEMQRQDAKKESGLAAACREALRKLQELLDRERGSAQEHDPGSGRSANIAALTMQIDKIKRLADGAAPGRRLSTGRGREQQQAASRRAPRGPVRNKGRRTTRRSGGR